MNKTKALSTVGISAAIIAGSMLAVTAANAQTEQSRSDQRAVELAERFDLDENEVKSYFEEKKAERRAEHEAKRAEHMAGLVEDGTLTQEQADALSAKQDEMREAKQALRDQDLTREEMHEQMEAFRAEFEVWAEEQGIDLDDIRTYKGEFKGHRNGRHGGQLHTSES